MELYQGTTKDFVNPDLSSAKKYTDFGPGFYLTEDIRMADDWKKGEPNKHINVYEVTLKGIETCNLRIRRFNQADETWAKFVYNNRKGKNIRQHYDLIVGPLADNGLNYWFDKVDKNEMTFTEAASHIEYRRFKSPQYCFITEKSLKLLSYDKRK